MYIYVYICVCVYSFFIRERDGPGAAWAGGADAAGSPFAAAARVWGLEFGAWGSRFRVGGLEFGV